jgi:hypothetical protein
MATTSLLFENTSFVADVVLILSASFAFFFVWLLRPRDHEGAVLPGRPKSIPTLESEWCGPPAPRGRGQDSARAEQEIWPGQRPARDAGRISRPRLTPSLTAEGSAKDSAEVKETLAGARCLYLLRNGFVPYTARQADVTQRGEPAQTSPHSRSSPPLASLPPTKVLHSQSAVYCRRIETDIKTGIVSEHRRRENNAVDAATIQRTRSVPSSLQTAPAHPPGRHHSYPAGLMSTNLPEQRSAPKQERRLLSVITDLPDLPARGKVQTAEIQTGLVKSPKRSQQTVSPVSPKSSRKSKSSGSLFYSNVVKVAVNLRQRAAQSSAQQEDSFMKARGEEIGPTRSLSSAE